MKYIDLFAGIGGFRYGLERVGDKELRFKKWQEGSLQRQGNSSTTSESVQRQRTFSCVYSNEWDKYASQIYCKNFCGRGCFEDKGQPKRTQARNKKRQSSKQLNDGTKGFNGCIDTRDITTVHASEIPDHDLLCAGFPCQSFSIAGKRKGFEDTRGTLFFEIARIARDKRPRYLLLENVKGLLSHEQGKTFQTMLRILTDLGYRVEWQVLNSKHFGVPQNRERVFIVGHLRGKSRPKVFPIRESSGIVESLDTSGGGGHQPCVPENMKIRRLTPTECERLQGFPDVEKYVIIKAWKQASANGAERVLNIRVTDQDSVAQSDVLIDCVENGVEIHSQGKLLLNAKNVEKKNWSHQHIKIDDFVQLLVGINTIKEKIMGHGKVGLHQKGECLTHQKNGLKLGKSFGKEIMQPVGDVKNDLITLNELLKFTMLSHSDTKNLEQKLQILSLFVIRAISGFIPKEILNRNTFTIGIKTKVGYTYGISDTQRYKCLGNAVTTSVITAIGESLRNI